MAEQTDVGQETRTEKSTQAFRTISEVANDLDVAQHVLRFWETKFPQISPLKRGGGRRYYRPEDVELLTQIRDLLYHEGYTIKGVQKLLRDQRRKSSGTASQPAKNTSDAKPAQAAKAATDEGGMPDSVRAELQAIQRDLRDLRTLIDRALR